MAGRTAPALLTSALMASLLLPILALAQEATPSPPPRTFTSAEQIVLLSPDGRSVATMGRRPDRLCVRDAGTGALRVCGDLKARRIKIRLNDIVWSPDSTRIAFAENSFQLLLDGDLWVMDAATGVLTNLTDDKVEGSFLVVGDANKIVGAVYEDGTPTWSPDGGSIAFSRSTILDGKTAGTVIAVVPASGGAVRTVTSVSVQEIGVVYYGMVWSPNGGAIAYSVMHTAPDDPENGIWTVGVDGKNPRRLIGSDPALGRPMIRAINATGETGLILYLEAASRAMPETLFLLNMATGERTAIPPPSDASTGAVVRGAVFSPDGAKLLVIVQRGSSESRVVVRDLRTGGETLVAALPKAGSSIFGQGPTWANDGTVFVTDGTDDGMDIKSAHLLFAETGPPPPPPLPGGSATPQAAATPTAGGAGGEIAPGATVATNDDVKLRGAPSTGAVAVADLPKGTALRVIGAAKAAERFVWWPVEEPVSGAIGYVRSEFIAVAG